MTSLIFILLKSCSSWLTAHGKFVDLPLCVLLSLVSSILCDFTRYSLIILLFIWKMMELHLFLYSIHFLHPNLLRSSSVVYCSSPGLIPRGSEGYSGRSSFHTTQMSSKLPSSRACSRCHLLVPHWFDYQ